MTLHLDVEVASEVIAACAAQNAARLQACLASTVTWLHYGTVVADGADAIVGDLQARESRLELKDIAGLRPGLVVARFEGSELLSGGSHHTGTRFRSYELVGGKLARSDVFGFRKYVLRDHGLSVGEVSGQLEVGSDTDHRLFHLQGPAQRYEWRRYVGCERSDHDHCGICWQKFSEIPGPGISTAGYVSGGDPSGAWLCPECLAEISRHFGIHVVGGPLDRATEQA